MKFLQSVDHPRRVRFRDLPFVVFEGSCSFSVRRSGRFRPALVGGAATALGFFTSQRTFFKLAVPPSLPAHPSTAARASSASGGSARASSARAAAFDARSSAAGGVSAPHLWSSSGFSAASRRPPACCGSSGVSPAGATAASAQALRRGQLLRAQLRMRLPLSVLVMPVGLQGRRVAVAPSPIGLSTRARGGALAGGVVDVSCKGLSLPLPMPMAPGGARFPSPMQPPISDTDFRCRLPMPPVIKEMALQPHLEAPLLPGHSLCSCVYQHDHRLLPTRREAALRSFLIRCNLGFLIDLIKLGFISKFCFHIHSPLGRIYGFASRAGRPISADPSEAVNDFDRNALRRGAVPFEFVFLISNAQGPTAHGLCRKLSMSLPLDIRSRRCGKSDARSKMVLSDARRERSSGLLGCSSSPGPLAVMSMPSQVSPMADGGSTMQGPFPVAPPVECFPMPVPSTVASCSPGLSAMSMPSQVSTMTDGGSTMQAPFPVVAPVECSPMPVPSTVASYSPGLSAMSTPSHFSPMADGGSTMQAPFPVVPPVECFSMPVLSTVALSPFCSGKCTSSSFSYRLRRLLQPPTVEGLALFIPVPLPSRSPFMARLLHWVGAVRALLHLRLYPQVQSNAARSPAFLSGFGPWLHLKYALT